MVPIADLDNSFSRYVRFDPKVPTWCVTPTRGAAIHRFYDTSPISPSGRFLALTRLPYEDRLPIPGDSADVLVVDLETGEEMVVAETIAWDTQLGAQAQWGTSDSELYFNDMLPREWQPFGVGLDIGTGKRKEVEGPVYMISPDGHYAASPCLMRTAHTQGGYGVNVPRERLEENPPLSEDDGVYVTDLETGRCSLVANLHDIVHETLLPEEIERCEEGTYYAFHVKWNPAGDRLMLVLRWIAFGSTQKDRQSSLITMRPDGSDKHLAIPSSEWMGKGGHHPNWCPDGEHIIMNLAIQGREKGLRFIQVRYDGTDCKALHPEIIGSGHPTLHLCGKILTDAYTHESVAFGDGTVPIRWVDTNRGLEDVLVRIPCQPDWKGPNNELRIDPHPAWDPLFKRIVFNGYEGGTRRVYLADLSSILP